MKVANFDKFRVFRSSAKAGQLLDSMRLHEKSHCYEMCYLLSGSIRISIADSSYRLDTDHVILFDGTFDHRYEIISDTEFIVVHLPKDIRVLEGLLDSRGSEVSQV